MSLQYQATGQREPLLELSDLTVGIDTAHGRIVPVRNVSFSVFPEQTAGLVGESGCGKTLAAMSVIRLLPEPSARVLAGRILLNGRNLLELSEREMRHVRGGHVGMIFQEPMTCLNPVMTIGQQICEGLRLHRHVSRRQAWKLAEESLRTVGVPDAGRRLSEYPHQMSGGMRQRVMMAMALSCRPRLLIADEPTTALDVTIQAQILDLLGVLRQKTGMAILLITHDLAVVAETADVVGVMYAGRIVEFAAVEELFERPVHPYTEGLFGSIPRRGTRGKRLAAIRGSVPNPAQYPPGCAFHPRCQRMDPYGGCPDREPALRQINSLHWVACHRAPGWAEGIQTQPGLDYRRRTGSPMGSSERPAGAAGYLEDQPL